MTLKHRQELITHVSGTAHAKELAGERVVAERLAVGEAAAA